MNEAAKLATEPYVFDGPAKEFSVEPPKPSIALLVMTKNGAKKLPILFQSVLGFADKAVILNTGTPDDDADMWLRAQKLLPITLLHAPFVDFSTSRNRLFEMSKGIADWFLLLDDDMTLEFTGDTVTAYVKAGLDLAVPAYLLQHTHNDFSYDVVRLVRGNRDWKYAGVTHEVLMGTEGRLKLKGVRVGHYPHYTADKFERDVRLLAADIARDPDEPRTIFYLANSFRDMGKIASAIRFYCMRANMGGWDEEVYVAMYEAARLAEDPAAMERAFHNRPTRAEPAKWLALHYAKGGNTALADNWEGVRAVIPMTSDVLFVVPSAYGPKK
jgi:glycosyltransferase involved in cell wall biosynthesis